MRPCLVNGKRALFHRWHTVDAAILNFKTIIKPAQARAIRDIFVTEGWVPDDADVEKLTNTFALVEFEDGTINDRVPPRDIRFLDSGNYFVNEPFDSMEAQLRKAEVNDGK